MANQLHVVCFGAHPDDAEIFAGGTLAAFRAAGARVTVVVGTDGSLSGGYPANAALAETRAKEAAAGAEALGVELELLGFADGYLSLATAAQEVIGDRLERYRPDLVITHHPDDVHRDHREMSRLVTARIDPAQKLLYIEPVFGLVVQPQVLFDTTEFFATKAASVRVHASQRAAEEILPAIETWNAFRGLQMTTPGVRYAEGFVVRPSPWAHPETLLAGIGKVRRL